MHRGPVSWHGHRSGSSRYRCKSRAVGVVCSITSVAILRCPFATRIGGSRERSTPVARFAASTPRAPVGRRPTTQRPVRGRRRSVVTRRPGPWAPRPPGGGRGGHRHGQRHEAVRRRRCGRRHQPHRAGGTILGLIGPSGSGKTTTVRLLTGCALPDGWDQSTCSARIPATSARQTRERSATCPSRSRCTPISPPRERRLRRVAVRHALARAATAAHGRSSSSWTSGRSAAGSAGGALGRDAATTGARLRPRSRPDRSCSSTSRPPVSTRCCGARSGTSCIASASAGRTLLVTTQYVNEAESCDRVALISRGRLIALASPTHLRRQAMGGDSSRSRRRGR